MHHQHHDGPPSGDAADFGNETFDSGYCQKSFLISGKNLGEVNLWNITR